VHLVRGEVQVNGHALKTGDAAMLDKETQIAISHGVDAEVLVFDLAP
jgi:redox-sensitive bicupin YhaK (pirin superfamily)